MNTVSSFKDKLIAFIDILGFKSKVEAAESGSGTEVAGLLDQCSKLGQPSHANAIALYGPTTCPDSRHVQRTLDYAVTQMSDSALISVEVSPAGVANLLHHVWAAVWSLLNDGAMVRGYVCRGSIYHEGSHFLGTGYQNAVEQEKQVHAFRVAKDESATPFVEIDPAVVEYVRVETDPCVREMFDRMTTSDAGGITVVYPVKRLSSIGGSGGNLKECEQNQHMVVGWIKRYLSELESQSPERDPRANAKAKYYRRFLNEELEKCEQMRDNLRSLREPAVKILHRWI